MSARFLDPARLQDPVNGHAADPKAGGDSGRPKTLAPEHLDTIRIDAGGAAAVAGTPQRRFGHDLGDPFGLALAAHVGFELGNTASVPKKALPAEVAVSTD